MRIDLYLLFFIFFAAKVEAQSFDLGSWNILNVKYQYNDKWSAFGEGQIRSLHFYDQFHYYEYKGGVNYKLHKAVALTLAMGSYQTYAGGGDFVLPKNNDEFRLWPQIVISQSIGKLRIEQRYRSEMRWTSNGYRNRFRSRIGLSYPFGNEIMGRQAFVAGLSNELFFTDNEPYFERNRILFSINYRIARQLSLQCGYLHQFDYKINDESGRDFLVVGLYFELFRQNSGG